jgi:hypothetical protein
LKGSRDSPQVSGLRQGIGSQVFSIAFFAAEEELFPPEGDGIRLFLGNITLTDGVLDQLFTRVLGSCNFSFRWGKSMFNRPVDRHQNN